MHLKKTKKFISILLIFGLIFTSGAFSFADEVLPDEPILELEELVLDEP